MCACSSYLSVLPRLHVTTRRYPSPRENISVDRFSGLLHTVGISRTNALSDTVFRATADFSICFFVPVKGKVATIMCPVFLYHSDNNDHIASFTIYGYRCTTNQHIFEEIIPICSVGQAVLLKLA